MHSMHSKKSAQAHRKSLLKYLDEVEQKRFDYVLVVQRDVKESKYFDFLSTFIESLQDKGINAELAYGNIKDNIYIKLEIDKSSLQELARTYQVDIANVGHHYISVSALNLPINQTVLTENHDIFRRKGEATTMERIFILHSLLEDTRFSDDDFDDNVGIQKLINLGVVKTAYPLHDGDCYYDERNIEILNDRQLLFKYWAKFSMWYKAQPLNLVEKYYGSEVAFYFAFSGLYNVMLIPASAIGVICCLINIFRLFLETDETVEEICNTNKAMSCPPCFLGSTCSFRLLKTECGTAKIAILFDNYWNFIFAVFMSFWAAAYLNIWKRTENILKKRWNVEHLVPKIRLRTNFRQRIKISGTSTYSQQKEMSIPWKTRVYNYALSYSLCFLMVRLNGEGFLIVFKVGLVFTSIIGIIMYRITLSALLRLSGVRYLITNASFIESVTSSIIQVIIIRLYAKIFMPFSHYLTYLENPRTQQQFDEAVIHKRYIFAFTNNYAGLFYIAFLKGRFFTPNHTVVPSFYADVCHTFGCSMPLCVQLLVILLLKSLVGNIITFITGKMKKLGNNKIIDLKQSDAPQWEKDFLLNPTGNYPLIKSYMDIIVQYGFVTFFVAVFPLAPLCALINNCLQMRINAYRLVTGFRRPVPKRNSGIGTWNKILKNITLLSIVTNAFVLAFTSDFVARTLYNRRHKTLKGYVLSTLSRYDMQETVMYNHSKMVFYIPNSTMCYYKGTRYPPEHPRRYQLSDRFWQETAVRLLSVIVFEHVIFLAHLLFSRIVPDTSEKLKEGIFRENNEENEKMLSKIDAKGRRLWRKGKKPTIVLRRKILEEGIS